MKRQQSLGANSLQTEEGIIITLKKGQIAQEQVSCLIFVNSQTDWPGK